MATDEDDVLDGELLRTVVRAASLAALHVVQEEKTRNKWYDGPVGGSARRFR